MLRKIKRDGSVRLDVDLGGACWIRTALVFVVVEVDLNREENKKALTNAHKLVCLFIILFFFFFTFFLKRNLVFILFDFFKQKQMESDVGGRDNVHRGALLV